MPSIEDGPSPLHRRPAEATDAAVAAAGKMTEALETALRAQGASTRCTS